MTQNTLPFTEITSEQIGTRNIARKNSILGDQIISIELSKIIIRENFNVRTDYGDLDSLALSIIGNGQTVPGKVDVLSDGTFLLTDGHRRFKALQLIAEMGDEKPLFKATINSRKITEEQRILQMFTTQDNKPLAGHEVAELIQRLINLGWKQNDIAKKIGKTPSYVSQMLSYASESPIIKEQVVNGTMNVSTALKLQKEIPIQSERVEAVQKAVKEKKEKAEAAKEEFGSTPDNKKSSPKLSLKEVSGKARVVPPPAAERMADKIMEVFEMPEGCKVQLVGIIKSYL